MRCQGSIRSTHCGCHAAVRSHGCTEHGPSMHAVHHGCCSPTQEDKQAWLERRLEGLRKATQDVEAQITALQQDQDAQK